MATPSYSTVNQARKLWDASRGTILPPVTPTPSKAQERPNVSPSLQQVQPPGLSKPGSKQSLMESTPLPSGRRRSVSFDEVYLQRIQAESQSSGQRSMSRLMKGGTNLSRQMPSSRISSFKEWDTSSEQGLVSVPSRERSSTLVLPGISSSHRDLAGEVRIRHPVLSIYKRGTYANHKDSWGSLNSKSSGYSYGLSRRCKQPLVEEKPKYENTYRMGPKTNFHLAEARIRKIIEDFLEDTLDTLTIKSATAKQAGHAAKGLVETIKHQVKLQRLHGYKIICLATICPIAHQDLVSSSRCIWNTQTDGFVSVTRQNKKWFGEVTVYGVYLE